ncbi:MAG: electron transfer flavoprotein subunit alpha/FixB family protein [Bacteroidia bacterium]
MSVAVFAESDNGAYKKSSFEAISYAKALASQLGTDCIAISINGDSSVDLGNYGADSNVQIESDALRSFNPNSYAKAIQEVCEQKGVNTLVFSQTYSGKALAPMLAVKTSAALITGVVSMADTSNGISVKKSCFSNKAIADVASSKEKTILSLIPNSYQIDQADASATVESFSTGISTSDVNAEIIDVQKVSGKIPLTEAELVVSGGRGLKGPENWGMIEELAGIIGAATACSKPVADMDWRPHGEHVGQTGLAIKPNLYIAIGISGAIQHLAGVGSSKVICVINTDPEAPFFKAADYGIVGDAFEVVPKLIKRAKEIMA